MIVYVITSHGFGHAARACEVIRHLPPELPLTICSTVPEAFLRERLGPRGFTLRPRAFDCGVLGPDSTQVDLGLTLDCMERQLALNATLLAEEVAWLRESGARVLVSDVAPFALNAAAEAGVRSVLIANFTWSGIYASLARALGEGSEADALRARTQTVIAAMQREYLRGDLLLVPGMAIPIEACRERRDVPIIAPTGRNRRMELCTAMNLDPARRVVLVYLGREGMQGMDWTDLTDDPTQYITFASCAPSSPLRVIPEGFLHPVDACASVDAVVAKCGYGICGECIAAGTPLLYPPRPQFAEYGALHTLMQSWGGGFGLDERNFKACAWAAPFAQLLARRTRFNALETSGGAVCAAQIAELHG